MSFQNIILELQKFWANKGCLIIQPIDMEVGAATFHFSTTLRALGKKPWAAAYVQACRRPTDGRYGQNPNRLQHYYQFQTILKPSPDNIQDLYLESLMAIGIDPNKNDIRFVEDNWESPTLGAWGLGWEVWCNGMEISQFTYFQQIGGFDCKPITGEITYGLERIAMFIQGKDNIFDIIYGGDNVSYGDIYKNSEVQNSTYNFEISNSKNLFTRFDMMEVECNEILSFGKENGKYVSIPAYEKCINASHIFNLLDARGVISVSERQNYILRIRNLVKNCCEAYLEEENN